MTPSERERRIEAAAQMVAGIRSFDGTAEENRRQCFGWAIAILDAADEAVPVVPATWDGLLEHLDAVYPADVFSGESGDVGARLVVLARKLAQVESENRVLKVVWEDDSEALQRAEAAARGLITTGGWVIQCLCDVIARKPVRGLDEALTGWEHAVAAFSGEEGTEG